MKLHDWHKLHGHTCVPISNKELGGWVSKQRQRKKKGKLSQQQVTLLSKIDFTWDTAEDDWQGKYHRLHLHFMLHGHSNVSSDEVCLASWVNTQRQAKKKGKLSESRKNQLNDLCFQWSPSTPRKKSPSMGVSDTALLTLPAPLTAHPPPNPIGSRITPNVTGDPMSHHSSALLPTEVDAREDFPIPYDLQDISFLDELLY